MRTNLGFGAAHFIVPSSWIHQRFDWFVISFMLLQCYGKVGVKRKLSLHWSSEELIQVSEISPKKDTCKCLSVWVCQPMTCAHAWLFPLWHTRFLLHKTSRTQIITLIYTMHPFPCVLFMLNWLEWKPNWRWLLTTADSDVSLCLSMLNRGQVFCEWMFGRVGGVRALTEL